MKMITLASRSQNITGTNMSIWSSIKQKYQFRKRLVKHTNDALDIVVYTFKGSYHLHKKDFTWGIKPFGSPVRVFNMTGKKESFKEPQYFVLLKDSTCFIFSALEHGCNKNLKINGEFNNMDTTYLNKFKNFLKLYPHDVHRMYEARDEKYSFPIRINSMSSLYLLAVCHIEEPEVMVRMDKKLSIETIEHMIKKELIRQHIGGENE